MLKLRNGFLYFGRTSEFRYASAWVKHRKSDAPVIDVEKLFIDDEVQKLLTDLTEIDMENKVFRSRRTTMQQRSHFALMTEERLETTRERMQEEARRFLQFVPVKEPKSEKVQILAKDSELEGLDNSKFVFTDITFDATDQDRTVVVREPDGSLRTANPEEHDRMNRTYYQKPNRPVFPPPVFEDPNLQNALDKGEHEFVLDWACWFYEPDDPAFVKLSHEIFDRVNQKGNFEVLTSTRHYGQFIFYLALNDNIPPLLNYFGGLGRVKDCANLIRLRKTLLPNWKETIAQTDSDEKIIKDYINQNNRYREQIPDLLNFLKDGTLKATKNNVDIQEAAVSDGRRRKIKITSANVNDSEGPLGDLSSEYSVKVVKSEGGAGGEYEQKQLDAAKTKEQKPRGRWSSYRKPQKPRSGSKTPSNKGDKE